MPQRNRHISRTLYQRVTDKNTWHLKELSCACIGIQNCAGEVASCLKQGLFGCREKVRCLHHCTWLDCSSGLVIHFSTGPLSICSLLNLLDLQIAKLGSAWTLSTVVA